MSVPSLTPSDNAPVAAAARLGLVGIVALSLGVLTAYAQEWFPPELGSLANSGGSWALVAFLLALLAVGARSAALSARWYSSPCSSVTYSGLTREATPPGLV